MKELRDRVALITGASRGIGVDLARALAGAGMRLVLAARSSEQLEAVADELRAGGANVLAVATDVADNDDLETLVARAHEELGAVDLLVNNAGLEATAHFAEIEPDRIEQVLRVNLVAPMRLTRLVLPGMQARRCGHIVNMASMAGVACPAFTETYATTKAALIAFTRTLRASARVTKSGLGASVICPGFITDAGMYADLQQEVVVKPPPLIGATTPDKVVRATLKAIRKNRGEVLVNPGMPRALIVIGALSPRLGEWLSVKVGSHKVFQAAIESRSAS